MTRRNPEIDPETFQNLVALRDQRSWKFLQRKLKVHERTAKKLYYLKEIEGVRLAPSTIRKINEAKIQPYKIQPYTPEQAIDDGRLDETPTPLQDFLQLLSVLEMELTRLDDLRAKTRVQANNVDQARSAVLAWANKRGNK